MSNQDNWNAIYIKNKADEYRKEYGYETVRKLAGFYGNVSLDLAHIFSCLHYKINKTVKTIQSFPGNEFLDGDLTNALRDFVFFIKEVNEIKENLSNSAHAFQMDADYDKTFNLCAKIIDKNAYLLKPDGFNNIKLFENKPLFFLLSTITVAQGQRAELKLIGEGSYAQVFKYKDPIYNRHFVVKRALKELSEQELERFKIEFEVMKSLHSPHVIEVYNYDEGDYQYVMEYADETLDKYYQQNNSKMTFHRRKEFASQILDAFQYIHRKNIMHRDISTSNILVKKYDDNIFLKVSDFGLVKQENSNLTNLHTELKGRFNDPQLEEIGFRNYKMHHETYALTRLIYFIMTGKKVLGSYKSEQFKTFVLRGLSSNTNDRYASVDELGSAFMKIVDTLKEVPVR